MKFKTSASLMIALVLGIVTAYVGIDVVKKAKAGAGNATKIVVAARDMEPGYVIETSDLKLEDVPATLVPAKAFKDPKLVAGRTVLATVVRGYPLIDNQLAAAGSGAGMQAMVPRGMRAVAVEVSEGGAVAGLITPGCYVDVIATFNDGEQTVATTVVQNVKVQFVQRTRPARSSNANNAAMTIGSPDMLGAVKTVTLIVTPKQANALELANNQGKPRLVLRGGEDDSDTTDAMVTQNELLGIPDPPPPATQPAPLLAAAPDPVAPPATPVERELIDAFEDVESLPIAPPPNRRPVYFIRAGEEETIYFEENGDRAMEETRAAQPPPPPRGRQQPTTRPQQPRKSSDQQPPQEQPQDGADRVTIEPRTASGLSPGDPAPRTVQGQRNLRKGM